MAITITCPGCAQQCAVADEHAGMQVSCPKCKAVITVPPLASAAPLTAAPVASAPAASPPPIAPPSPGVEIGKTLDAFFQTAGFDPLSKTLFYAGAGCLGGMMLMTFLPWVSIPSFGPIQGASVLGISTGMGALHFVVTGGVLGFLAFVIFGKQSKLLDIGLWSASGWAALDALWRLVDVIRLSSLNGIGLILTLLCALGAAATLGFIVFQRLMKKK
ncbi:MAG: hypothetical protein HY040_19870 [Planctomycetes bacterium]|nr:hypothetical protein [Planctomycetota bacterium]